MEQPSIHYGRGESKGMIPVINPPPLPLLLHRHHHHQPAHHQGREDTSMPSRPTSGLFLLYFWHNVPCLEQRVYVVRVSLSSCRATSAARCRYWYHGHVYVPVLSVQFNATAEPSSRRLGSPPLYMNWRTFQGSGSGNCWCAGSLPWGLEILCVDKLVRA